MSSSEQMHRDVRRLGAHDRARTGPIGAVDHSTDQVDWDDFVERTIGGDLVQTSAWARLKQTSGLEVHRIIVRVDGTIVGGVQLLARRIPLLGAVAYAPYGPVVAPDADDDTVALLVDRLRRFCADASVRALFVQLPQGGGRLEPMLRSIGFEPTHMDVAPCATVRIDLERTPDELLDGMSKHTRRDVRQSFREPVRVRFATRADLPTFYELYCCTAARQEFTPLPFRYLEHMWDELHPVGHLEILMADVDGVDVSGNMVSCFADTVTGRWLGFDAARLQQRLRPNEALIWAAMSWARARGCRWLDVGGVNQAAIAAAEQLPLKLRFGGEAVAYPDPLKLIVNPYLRGVYRVVGSNESVRRFRQFVARRARAGALKRKRP